jgi:hypothetical protein
MGHRPTIELWGVGPSISARLARHGIGTVAELADADVAVLVGEFGPRMRNLVCRPRSVPPLGRRRRHSVGGARARPSSLASGLARVGDMRSCGGSTAWAVPPAPGRWHRPRSDLVIVIRVAHAAHTMSRAHGTRCNRGTPIIDSSLRYQSSTHSTGGTRSARHASEVSPTRPA